MKTAFGLFTAVFCLTAPAAPGATLTCTGAYRYLESGVETFESTDPFGDLDMEVAGLDSFAEQRSTLGTVAIVVSSRIAGLSERGASFFEIVFTLDAPSAWSLSGSIELLGSTGFACVSFQDLAHRDTTIVNEIIYAPPLVSETRPLSFAGMLEPGSYLLEAMIYGGGDNQFTRGSIDAVFAIPEPEASLLVLPALFRRTRRRQVIH